MWDNGPVGETLRSFILGLYIAKGHTRVNCARQNFCSLQAVLIRRLGFGWKNSYVWMGRHGSALQTLVPFASCPPTPLADTNLSNRLVGGGRSSFPPPHSVYLMLCWTFSVSFSLESVQSTSRIKMIPALRKLRISLRWCLQSKQKVKATSCWCG